MRSFITALAISSALALMTARCTPGPNETLIEGADAGDEFALADAGDGSGIGAGDKRRHGDAGVADAGVADAGVADAGVPDAGTISIWKPRPGQQWQWQLTGMPVDQSVNVPIYDLDAEGTSASTVASLHAAGRRVICYIDVGALESYRGDFDEFPSSILGNTVADWPDERWLDIRALDGPKGPTGKTLRQLLTARIQMCAAKGFDALEPDLLEGYQHSTGFPLTWDDQLAFNRFIAQAAHQLGMSVALKNDKMQSAALVGDYDFVIDEECQVWHECTGPGTWDNPGYAPFVQAGKAVLNAEYTTETSTCGQPAGFSSILKHLTLDAWRVQCPH